MKFLLIGINAKYIHSNPALYSLKAYAGSESTEIAEFTINQRKEDILAGVYLAAPDALGISCYIWNWGMVSELLPDLHKILPNVPIWLGGPEVSWRSREILEEFPFLTGIMIGEGEATYAKLLSCYEGIKRAEIDSIPYETIPGICFRNHAGIKTTPPSEPLELSSIPFLYGEKEGQLPADHRIIYYETSRGCPFRCSYCLSAGEKGVRLRDLSLVKSELQFFLDRKVSQVKFVDRSFNCEEKHALAIWTYLKEHDNGITNFHFEVEADLMTERELEVISDMRPGLIQMEIGVQSANPETLRSVHRNPDLSYLEEVTAKIKSFGNIHVHLDLIAGLPKEDYQSFGKSFNRVYGMHPDQLQLGFLKALHGTEIREHAADYDLRFEEYAPYEVLCTDLLSYGDVLLLKQIEEMTELYYNSGQFGTTLPVLETYFDSPFDLYEQLAAYYQRNRLFVQTPSRSYRYQVLLDFICEIVPEKRDFFAQLLTVDLYLRENCKSRPAFSLQTDFLKDTLRDFYRTEEENRRYLPEYKSYDRKQLRTMTHIEPLFFDEKGEKTEMKLLLFDYQRRDPLSGNAFCQILSEEQYGTK